ncbi:MAG: hypothetical protein HYS09_07085 [Chloroflexi bacterium]|nr:hypothetical protein [Chloroflexota bacterium]
MSVYRSSHRQQIIGVAGWDWRWPLATAVLTFQFVFVFWLVSEPGGAGGLLWFDDISFVIAPSLAGFMAAVVAARNWGGRAGYAWAFVSLGLFMAAFGETAWGVQELGMGIEVPFPSIADAGYLGMYPPVFLGLLLMPQAPVSGLRRLKLSLDTLTAMLAIAVISWYLILASLISQSSGSAVSQAIAVAYPFADLGLVFALLVLIVRAGPGLSATALSLLGAGFASIALADSVYTYLSSVQGYASGSYIDIGWMLGYNLVTLATLPALSRLMVFERSSPDEEAPPPFWPSLIPYAGLLLLITVHATAFIQQGGDRQFSVFLEAGTLTVVALVSARQLITISEEVRLNRELAAMTADLEVRVKSQALALLRRQGAGEPEPTGEPPNGADEPVGGLGPPAGARPAR